MKKIFNVFTKKEWLLSSLAITLILVGSVFDVLSPYFFAEAMNNISFQMLPSSSSVGMPTEPSVTWNHDLIVYLSLTIAFPFITIACTVGAVFFATRVSVGVTTKVRQEAYSKALRMSAADLDRITGASVVTRTTLDVQQILMFLVMFFSTFVKAISLIIGGFTLSIYQLATWEGNTANFNLWYLAFVYLLFPLLILMLGIVVKKGIPLFKKTRYAIDENNVIMQENIIGNRMVRSHNMQEAQMHRYEIGNNSLKKKSISSDLVFVIINPIITLIMNASSILIFLFCGMYAYDSLPKDFAQTSALVGVAQAFINYFLQMLVGLSLLGMVSMVYGRARASASRIYEIIENDNPIKSGTSDALITKGDVEFKNVCFRYNEMDAKNVLNNISFKIKSGETLGILGQTGSGKTSLVNLIMRLYDTTEGEILIDGLNIKDYQLKNLRQEITMALQEKVLIRGTVRENILIGNQNATDEEMIAAAKDAQAYEFISKLPKKFDAPVDQKGKNFSGGQQQRISIARALIKKSKILVFDDSTSALDNMTEAKLLTDLKQKYADRTKIIISQKVRTVKNADTIIVLKNGKIAEMGKHNELIKLKGLYNSIYESQESSMEK